MHISAIAAPRGRDTPGRPRSTTLCDRDGEGRRRQLHGAYALELGAAEAVEMAAIAEAWTRWANDPGALVARFWVTALGWVPS